MGNVSQNLALSGDRWLLLGWVAAIYLGAVAGSFLNVVASRLPPWLMWRWGEAVDSERRPPGLFWPPSHCTACGHHLRWYENIPIVSFLWLRGRCNECSARIPRRYLVVECLGVALGCLPLWRYGFGAEAAAVTVALWWLLAISLIDLDTMLLPHVLSWPLVALGLLVNIHGLIAPLTLAVIGAVVGYLAGLALHHGWRLVRGREGLGGGDIVMFAAMGAWVGIAGLEVALLIAALLALLVVPLGRCIRRGGHGQPFPFGPFLAVGLALSLILPAGVVQTWPALLTRVLQAA